MKKKNSFIFFIFTSFILFCFTACGNTNIKSQSKANFGVTKREAAPMMSGTKNLQMLDTVTEELFIDSKISENKKLDNNLNTERKLIRNGYLSVQVDSLSDAEEKCIQWCKKHNGYISNSNSNDRNVNLTLRIPAKYFDNAINDLTMIGKVVEKNINTQDVTENFFDLTTRLDTRKILHERLLGYLKNSTKVDEMIKVEKQINDVQTEIESMQGQLNRLSNQIDFCTLTVNIHLPKNTNEQGFIWPSLGNDLKDLLSRTLYFFEGFLLLIIQIIIFGVPIVLFIAFLYWLTFGKLGLVKKLFKKLRK
ncbi:MAG: DUF4349 domain-containing protein [Treponema sp.]|nr:DUF4349 domain-containing protein [Treponema sp.]